MKKRQPKPRVDPWEAEPPPLPELSEDNKQRSLYRVPFPEAFGKERTEILLACRECNAASIYEMWDTPVDVARHGRDQTMKYGYARVSTDDQKADTTQINPGTTT
jgi:hypothetical protein